MPDRLFDALADRQRRLLVATLERDRGGDGGALALDGNRIGEASGLSREALYHVHLPKLSDAGIVEWNRETGEIAAGPRFDDACRLLGLADGCQDEVPVD